MLTAEQENKVQMLFAAYAALAVPLLVVMVGFAEGAASARDFTALFDLNIAVVTSAGIISVFLLLLVETRVPWLNTRAFRAGVYTCLAFLIPTLAIGVAYEFSLYFIVDTFVYAVAFGVIAGVARYEEDFSFIADPRLSEASKHARLDKCYDLLARGLTVFTPVYFLGVIVGGAVPFAKSSAEAGHAVEIASIASVIGYLTAGIIAGVYVRLLRAMVEIKDKYTAVAGSVGASERC